MANEATGRLSEEFRRLAEFCQNKDLTVKEIIDEIGPNDQALITLILSVPFLLFIPIPGLSTLLGFFICFTGYRIAARKHLWLPRFLSKKKISGNVFAKGLLKAEKIAQKVERMVRPRGKFFHRHPGLIFLNGLIVAFGGVLLALPLPPGTNFTPAVMVALISIGILEDDELFIVLGYLFFFFNAALFILLPIMGWEGIKNIFS
jgi:hypothetical protein